MGPYYVPKKTDPVTPENLRKAEDTLAALYSYAFSYGDGETSRGLKKKDPTFHREYMQFRNRLRAWAGDEAWGVYTRAERRGKANRTPIPVRLGLPVPAKKRTAGTR